MFYYETARIRIWWDEGLKSVVAEGEGYIDGEDLHAGMNAGIDLLGKKNASKWLADMRFRRALPEADMVWIAQDFTPRAVEAGMRYIAIVVPTSVLGMMTLKITKEKTKITSYETRHFDSVDDARIWLASV